MLVARNHEDASAGRQGLEKPLGRSLAASAERPPTSCETAEVMGAPTPHHFSGLVIAAPAIPEPGPCAPVFAALSACVDGPDAVPRNTSAPRASEPRLGPSGASTAAPGT